MIKRREFCKSSLLAVLAGVAGCSRGMSNPTLTATSETLPKELLSALPVPWVFQELNVKTLKESSQILTSSNADLFAIGDGWIPQLEKEFFRPIESPKIYSRLNEHAEQFLESFGQEISIRVVPIGVSPWVMLFRNGQEFSSRAKAGWDVLLDPELKGKLVLPESPRLVMSIADQIGQADGLRQLRQQALTFDDKNGLNWVLSGRARVAILPLYRCFSSLSRDLRLSVFLPESGAPLHWTFLARPINTKQPFPESWIAQVWSMPLMVKLLARGWIPPINDSELRSAIENVPNSYRQILLSTNAFWDQNWSLPYLPEVEIVRLENIWRQSTP